jgi:hypothetical protein
VYWPLGTLGIVNGAANSPAPWLPSRKKSCSGTTMKLIGLPVPTGGGGLSCVKSVITALPPVGTGVQTSLLAAGAWKITVPVMSPLLGSYSRTSTSSQAKSKNMSHRDRIRTSQ